jgi:threonine dehydratase
MEHTADPNLELESIKRAQTILMGKTIVTPLLAAGTTRTPCGNPIYLKAENLQPGGSFKIRGATYCLSLLTEQQRAGGVVAYSTGNHAQAVALAAKQQGIQATIVMSPDAPNYKVEATQRYGATVVMAETTSQARRELAEHLAMTQGLYLVPPYDSLDVMAGQGTIGLELLEQIAPAAVFVPIGGGGLIAGIAAAIKQNNPGVQIIGVEPEWENDAYQSFHLGHRVTLSTSSKSIADAIRVQTLGELTYPIIRRYVDDIVTVSEAEIASATLMATMETHLLLEPAGALGLAATLTYAKPLAQDKPVIALASGGNTTLENLYHLQLTKDSA